MQKKIRESIAVYCFAAICLIVISGNVLFVWVATGPRALPFVTPYIERALAADDSSYTVQIQETLLAWEGWRQPLDLKVRGVSIKSENAVFARFPEISVGLNLLSLIIGRIEPRSLEIRNADVVLRRDEDGNIRFVLEDGQSDTKPLSLSQLQKSSGNPSRSSHVQKIAIRSAKVKLLDQAGDVLLQVPSLTASVGLGKLGYYGNINLEMTEGTAHAYLNMQGQYFSADASAALSAEFRDFRPRLVAVLFPAQKDLAGIDLPASGKASLALASDRTISSINFDVTAGAGELSYDEELPEPLHVKTCSVRGSFKNALQELTLQSAICDFGHPVIAAHGMVRFAGDQTEAHLVGSATELATKDLPKYWPKSLGPETRDWVVTRISNGRMPSGSVTVNILPGDTALPALPEQAIRARVEANSIDVRYKPSHPAVQNADAVAYFTGKSMQVDISAASMLSGTKLKSGFVHVEDLNIDNPDVVVKLDLAAPAVDVANFLSLPDIALAQKANLEPKRISGNAEAKIDLALKMYSDRPGGDKVDVNTEAKLIDVSQPALLKKYDVRNFSGDLKASNASLQVKGKGIVNDVSMTVEADEKFLAKGQDTHVIAEAENMPIASFPRFGFNLPSQIAGATGIKLDYRETDASAADITLNLLNAELTVAELAHRKAKNIPATLSAKLEQQSGGPIRIPAFTYDTQGMSAKGNALLTRDGGLQAVRFDSLRQGNSEVALAYGKENGRTRLEIKGDSFDMSNRVGEEGNFSTEDWQNLDMQADIKRVILKEGRELSNVKAMLDCGQSQCQRGTFVGNVGSKPFSFSLATQGGNRRLTGKAADAGALINALGVYSNLVGGRLSIEAKGPSGKPLEGALKIDNHSIRNAPALTKLLTVASLTGIVDSLRGEGISFKELTAPFAFSEDVITLKEAKDYGPALGLTADGTLSLRKGQMDLTGTIVPSYTLNSLVEKVPLIGTALTGGKGQGIFATRYSMRGPMGDPEINLNPLSMLTPGFTRNIFNIFNRPAPKDLKRMEVDAVPPATQENSSAGGLSTDNGLVDSGESVKKNALPAKSRRGASAPTIPR